MLTFGIAATPPWPRPVDSEGQPSSCSPWTDLREGLAYVWNTPSLLAAMWIAFLVNFRAFPLSNGLLPYVAKETYLTDQTVLGYLAASFAFGALAGSIMLSAASSRIHPGRMMILFAGVWYAALLAFAQTKHAGAGIAVLIVAGFMQSLCVVPLSVVLLRSPATNSAAASWACACWRSTACRSGF